jgi:hypothetical protein
MPAKWTENLKTISGLKPIAGLRQPWEGKISVDFADGKTDVTPEDGYRSPVLKRKALDLRDVNAHALKHLTELPGPGESYHFLIGDRLGLWDIVPALAERVKPATIRELWVSTLSYGSATAAALLAMLDSRTIGRVHLLVSVMFSAKNRNLYDELVPPLQQRGQRASAMRTHAKLLCVELTTGERYVIESSSNLRSCHCCEQVTVIRDDGLFDFHCRWIDRALGGKGAK